MKNISRIFAAAILLGTIIFTAACDEIDHPFKESGGSDTSTTTNLKKVLLEDYTGHNCPNCPRAHDIAKEIVEQYKGNVILVAIHEGGHAQIGGSATYNFTTKDGSEIDKVLKVAWEVGTPNGMVDRVKFGDKQIFGPDEWSTYVAERIQATPKTLLELNASYNIGTKEITANVKIEYKAEGTENDNLCVFMLEDSIIKYQLDIRKQPNKDVFDYVHMNVFRGAMNGAWGEQLSTTPIASGTKLDRTVKFTIPASKDWVPKNMRLVAFVHNNMTKEIYQAEEVKLIK